MDIVPWRAFMWVWCAPGLAAAAILLFLPESPRYLLAAKGPKVALPVLAKMYAWNHGCSAEEFPVSIALGKTLRIKGEKASNLLSLTSRGLPN